MIEIGGDNYIETSIDETDHVFKLTPTISCDEYTIGADIHYVHELQDLYHALTGKNLKLNERGYE